MANQTEQEKIDNYQSPKGCPRNTLPARSFQHPEYFCLFSVNEGHYFGRCTKDVNEIIKRADKENMRHRDYNLALGIPI